MCPFEILEWTVTQPRVSLTGPTIIVKIPTGVIQYHNVLTI